MNHFTTEADGKDFSFFFHYKELIKHLSIISASGVYGLRRLCWWGVVIKLPLNKILLFILSLSPPTIYYPLYLLLSALL